MSATTKIRRWLNVEYNEVTAKFGDFKAVYTGSRSADAIMRREGVDGDFVVDGPEGELARDPDGATALNEGMLAMDDYWSIEVKDDVPINTTQIYIPSRTAFINRARIYQEPDTVEKNFVMIQNLGSKDGFTRFEDMDEDIVFACAGGGFVDGQAGKNYDLANTHTVSLNNIRRLYLKDPVILRSNSFSISPSDCVDVYATNLRMFNFGESTNQDGVHFGDCDNVVDGILGQTQDDLLAITCHSFVGSIDGYAINNVVGRSIYANGIRINKAAANTGDGNEVRIRNIDITNANIYGTRARICVYGNADDDTYYENVNLEATGRDIGWEGVLVLGHARDCDIDITTRGNQRPPFRALRTLTDCDVKLNARDSNQTRAMATAAEAYGTTFDINTVQHPEADAGHLFIRERTDNEVKGKMEDGQHGVVLGTVNAGETVERTRIRDLHVLNPTAHGVQEVSGDYNLVYGSIFHNTGEDFVNLNGANSKIDAPSVIDSP